MTHTIGPWTTTGSYIYGPNDEEIGVAHHIPDSRLIAAGPDMLEALQEAVAANELRPPPYRTQMPKATAIVKLLRDAAASLPDGDGVWTPYHTHTILSGAIAATVMRRSTLKIVP